MIDNIKFHFQHIPDESWLQKVREEMVLLEIYSTQAGKKGYKGKLYFEKGIKVKGKNYGTKGANMPSLLIEVNDNINAEGATIKISNSLRKWYFNDSISRDFTRKQFAKCLKLIANKLHVPKSAILGAIVTRAEYGATINFKPSYRCFYRCIFSHKDIMKKSTIGNETVAFLGETKKVVFYDKITETRDKKKMSAVIKKAANKKVFSLRYEISKTKISVGDA